MAEAYTGHPPEREPVSSRRASEIRHARYAARAADNARVATALEDLASSVRAVRASVQASNATTRIRLLDTLDGAAAEIEAEAGALRPVAGGAF